MWRHPPVQVNDNPVPNNTIAVAKRPPHDIAHGDTIRQTARTLGIATKTVENTQARLFRKLDAPNRAQALTMAYRLGLIEPAAAAPLGELCSPKGRPFWHALADG